MIIRSIYIACFTLCAIVWMACNNHNTKAPPASEANELEIVHEQDDGRFKKRYCYELLEGQGQDLVVTSIWIEFTGDTVDGVLQWIPYEKDAALGTIKGWMKDSIITCAWEYDQEGMSNETQLMFRFSEKGLHQREQSWDETTGVPFTRPDAPFTIYYPAADCDELTAPTLRY